MHKTSCFWYCRCGWVGHGVPNVTWGALEVVGVLWVRIRAKSSLTIHVAGASGQTDYQKKKL